MIRPRKYFVLGGIFLLVTILAIGYLSHKVSAPVPIGVKPVTQQPTPESSVSPQALAKIADDRRRAAARATIQMLESYAAAYGVYPKTSETLREAVDTYGKMIASSTLVVYQPVYDPTAVPSAMDIFYYVGYVCAITEPTPSLPHDIAVRYTVGASAYECIDSTLES